MNDHSWKPKRFRSLMVMERFSPCLNDSAYVWIRILFKYLILQRRSCRDLSSLKVQYALQSIWHTGRQLIIHSHTLLCSFWGCSCLVVSICRCNYCFHLHHGNTVSSLASISLLKGRGQCLTCDRGTSYLPS